MLSDLTRERYEVFAKLVRRKAQSGRWLVLTHDNPDPDSIASAAGLAKVLRRSFRRQVRVAYGGIIGRAENQELVKVLGVHISHIRHLDVKKYKHYALVDTQPGTGNNALDGIIPDLVFDHHPVRSATRKVPFSDIRTDYGATATMIAEYISASGWELTKKEATAFLYAVRSETQDFGREFSPHDRTLFDELLPKADLRALARIQTPVLPLSYYQTLHEALEKLESVGSLVISHLGAIPNPDIVPEIADLLLRMRGMTWSLCTGVLNDRIYLSLRTTNSRADAGRLMRRILGRRGRGGGHGMMAGGWIEWPGSRSGSAEGLQRYLAQRLATILKKKPERITPIAMKSSPTPTR